MRKILACLAALVGLVLFVPAGPASAAAVTFNGLRMEQYDPGHWPIIALVDHTTQSPNWYHVRDQGFPLWHTPLNASNGVRPMFQLTGDCAAWPNRVCYEMVERPMNASGSVDGCQWTGTPTLVGDTCTFGFYDSNGVPRSDKAVTVMASNQHGLPSNVRVAAATHEIGHAWGLGHSSDPAYLMYPTVDGSPTGPRGDEYGCVYQVYNAPPCSSDNTPNVATREAQPAVPVPLGPPGGRWSRSFPLSIGGAR